MAEIKPNFGYADSADHRSGGEPTLASALRDVADDAAGLQCSAAVEDDATDLDSAIALVNELKGIINAQAAYTVKTTKG